MLVDKTRVLVLDESKTTGPGPVVYWMQREQRVKDNWALLLAREYAAAASVPLVVVFTLVPARGPNVTARRYDFMRQGLEEVERDLRALGIPFHVLWGDPALAIKNFVDEFSVGQIVTDQNPLRRPRAWQEAAAAAVSVRFSVVDAHNVVPVWVASQKVEFAAHTFRPKINAHLKHYLTDFPELESGLTTALPAPVDWDGLFAKVSMDKTVAPVSNFRAGSRAAEARLLEFCTERLAGYAVKQNDPNIDGQSNLSPYLHFGQLSAQRVALAVSEAAAPTEDKERFLEELLVRRELSDNFCFYTRNYGVLESVHPWAQLTLKEHESDEREFTYVQADFEQSQTHDDLWNAMQKQLFVTGKLHGWCRMYWAKKILEWTPDASTAIKIALYLNDRYSLDGNDPNGVVGVLWSIAGVHDRAWGERPVFGKIRYMNFAGAKRKFDVNAYIDEWLSPESKVSF